MAIVQVLERHGKIDSDALAQTFAQRYVADPARGYGAGAHELLRRIANGADWREVSRSLFGGEGSFGNGGAMRAGPLGAWFADDVEATIENARVFRSDARASGRSGRSDRRRPGRGMGLAME